LKVARTEIPEVLLLEPQVFADARGEVFESYNRRALAEATGLDLQFVQENHSRSVRNVLRGLHYQIVRPQGKLVHAVRGEIFDVAVDRRELRIGSCQDRTLVPRQSGVDRRSSPQGGVVLGRDA